MSGRMQKANRIIRFAGWMVLGTVLSHPAIAQKSGSDAAIGDVFAKSQPGEQQESKRKLPDGNSVVGRIHRGLLGPQQVVKPNKMFALPADLPPGQFLMSHLDEIVYSVLDAKQSLTPLFDYYDTPYAFGSTTIRAYADGEFESRQVIPHVSSYSQTNKRLSYFVGTVEGMLLSGDVSDWATFTAKMDKRGKFSLYTDVVTEDKTGRLGKIPAIAVQDDEYKRIVAVSDLYHPHGDDAELEETAFYARLRLLRDGRVVREADNHNKRPSSAIAGRKALAEFAPYRQLVFSPDGRYLAGLMLDGRVRVLNASTLETIFTLDVDMLGPYVASGPKQGAWLSQFRTPRINFDTKSELLLGTDRGQVFACELRTESLHKVELPGAIDTCSFQQESIIAASGETGEVYLIDTHSLLVDKPKLRAKALLAGLGPLATQVNFSQEGEALSAIFSDKNFVAGKAAGGNNSPVAYAMFWDLRFIKYPTDKISPEYSWYCRPELRERYPGQTAAFVSLNREKSSGELSVLTFDREQKQFNTYPLRALATDAQRHAILLHSLVEQSAHDKDYFDPRASLTEKYPGIAETKSVASATNVPTNRPPRYNSPKHNSAAQVLWRRQFGAGSAADIARDVAIDSEGSAIVCGDAAEKGFIRKYTAKGQLVWEVRLADLYGKDVKSGIGSSPYHSVWGVEVDALDYIYFVGDAHHYHKGAGGRLFNQANVCYGKIGPDGRVIVSKWIQRNRYGGLCDIARRGEVFAAAGYMKEGAAEKWRETSDSVLVMLNRDLKGFKMIDDDPTVTSAKEGADPSKKFLSGVAFTSDGGVVLSGRARNYRARDDRFIQKRDDQLNILWTHTLPIKKGWFRSEWPAIAVDSEDNIYVSLSVDMSLRGSTDDTAYIAKYRIDGELLWEKTFDTRAERDVANRMAIAHDDSVLIAAEYNHVPTIIRMTTDGKMPEQPFKLFPSKLVNSGTTQAVAIGADGTIYAAGKMEGEQINADVRKPPGPSGPWDHYGSNYAFLVKLRWGDLRAPPAE